MFFRLHEVCRISRLVSWAFKNFFKLTINLTSGFATFKMLIFISSLMYLDVFLRTNFPCHFVVFGND